jgi:hypothetical protein
MFGINTQEERFARLAEDVITVVEIPTTETLEKSILKVAQDEEFNSEQIRRLSEATNQLMYTRMLESEENKFDKTAEFPLVDPQKIIGDYYSENSEPINKVAAEISTDISDYYKSPDDLFSRKRLELTPEGFGLEKTSEEREQVGLDPHKDYFEKLCYAQKIRDTLVEEKTSEYVKVAECIDTLACLFSYDTGPDQRTFEKKAFALYGDSCLPILNVVREQTGMPEIKGFSGDFEKIGTIIIDDSGDEFDLLKTAMESASSYSRLNKKLEVLTGVIGEV